MRIALVTPGFSADERDWCIPVLLNLVRELSRQAEVHVFALRYPHRRGTYQVYGATVHAFGGGVARGAARLPLLWQSLATLVRQHNRQPFDVLHGFWADEPGFLAVVAGQLLGVPGVVSLMGGELVGLPDIGYGGQLSRANRWLVAFALRRAQLVTGGSKFLRDLAQRHVPPERLALVPLGIDTRMFQPGATGPARLLDGEIKLLHVGSMAPVKDHAMLLYAFCHLAARCPGAFLHLVGDGPLRADLQGLAAELGVGQSVRFHGAVRHDELPDYYRAADLCVSSSRFESQLMVALEAAACERPTVGTAVGLLPELAPAALSVPVDDAVALAEALLALLQDEGRRVKMGRRARALVEESYSLDQTLDKLLGLYAMLHAAWQTGIKGPISLNGNQVHRRE